MQRVAIGLIRSVTSTRLLHRPSLPLTAARRSAPHPGRFAWEGSETGTLRLNVLTLAPPTGQGDLSPSTVLRAAGRRPEEASLLPSGYALARFVICFRHRGGGAIAKSRGQAERRALLEQQADP